ncbi:hypothetical protein FIV00_03215 [Labrenzia sp. THAF82]|uniref:hypothetical protein n=1 Tax=Labrenzia sp. THAF82 TaxID=2587861 RepID=UPI0012AAA423|nr:hypothetical protein [Labrenzia sp. THAF82]QFT29481.1 hypothetical protein FIV00_03215 [Labrenzia sp. THAF82]
MSHAVAKIRLLSAEEQIRVLAKKHDISVARTALDDWADDVTRLAGDDVRFDEVQELVVALRRARVVDGVELTRLHSRYLDER